MVPLDGVEAELADNHQDLGVLVSPVSGLYQALLAGCAPALWLGRLLIGRDLIEAESAIALRRHMAADESDANVAVGAALYRSRIVAHAA